MRLTEQLNIRVTADIYKRVEKIAARERRKIGDVTRMILEWALPDAEASESLAQLFLRKARPGDPRDDGPKVTAAKR